MPQPAPPSDPMARKQTPTTPPDPANDPFHVKLRRLIDKKARGRTDSEIAEAAGLRPNKLSQMLTGKIPDPRFSTMLRLFRALGATSADYERA